MKKPKNVATKCAQLERSEFKVWDPNNISCSLQKQILRTQKSITKFLPWLVFHVNEGCLHFCCIYAPNQRITSLTIFLWFWHAYLSWLNILYVKVLAEEPNEVSALETLRSLKQTLLGIAYRHQRMGNQLWQYDGKKIIKRVKLPPPREFRSYCPISLQVLVMRRNPLFATTLVQWPRFS